MLEEVAGENYFLIEVSNNFFLFIFLYSFYSNSAKQCNIFFVVLICSFLTSLDFNNRFLLQLCKLSLLLVQFLTVFIKSKRHKIIFKIPKYLTLVPDV